MIRFIADDDAKIGLNLNGENDRHFWHIRSGDQCKTEVCSNRCYCQARLHSRDNFTVIYVCILTLGYVELGCLFTNQRRVKKLLVCLVSLLFWILLTRTSYSCYKIYLSTSLNFRKLCCRRFSAITDVCHTSDMLRLRRYLKSSKTFPEQWRTVQSPTRPYHDEIFHFVKWTYVRRYLERSASALIERCYFCNRSKKNFSSTLKRTVDFSNGSLAY